MTPIEKLYHVAVNVNTEDVNIAVLLTKEEGKELEEYFETTLKYGNPEAHLSNGFGSVTIFNKKVYIYIV